MNEQIKLLAEEAGFVLWCDEEWNPGETIDWASNYDNTIVKYTELVVNSVFESLRQTSEKHGAILAEDVRRQILQNYGLDYE